MSREPHRDENAIQAILGSADAIDVDGERALWAAVLQQAVHDATRTVFPRNAHGSQTSTSAAEQRDARVFLSDMERLGPVCELLGLDVHWVQAQLQQQYPALRHTPDPGPLENDNSWALQWEVLWL